MPVAEKTSKWTPERLAQKGTEYAMFVTAILYFNNRCNNLETEKAKCQEDKINLILRNEGNRTALNEERTVFIINDTRRSRTNIKTAKNGKRNG